MSKYPNQFVIKNLKETEWIDPMSVMIASQTLNGVAFKLFLYLCMMEPQESAYFSPADFCARMGVAKSSAHNAFTELIVKKYLVQKKNDLYYFNIPKIEPNF